jgi:hypothetical protein
MRTKLNETKLQVIWTSVFRLRIAARERKWLEAQVVYHHLIKYELAVPDEDARLVNIIREGCEFYESEYNIWLKEKVFGYA